MSMTAPIVVKSGTSHTSNSGGGGGGGDGGDSSQILPMQMLSGGGPSRELTGNRLFQFYMESFFKIPRDIKNDIIYCQRAMKAHIKVHQMVLDVFEQQPDADPQQKKRIVDELELEIYEINAEQNFLFLRLRRVIEEFYKMLKKNGIPTDTAATNSIVSKEIVPFVNDTSIDIVPVAVMHRNSEEKLIEKYFEVQKDSQPQQEAAAAEVMAPPETLQYLEVIDLVDDCSVANKVSRSQPGGKRGGISKKDYQRKLENSENLLRQLHAGVTQTSLLKPMNQRRGGVYNDMAAHPVEVRAKQGRKSQTLAEMYSQKNLRQVPKEVVMAVSTNVSKSRLNLRQALKKAQAAIRGPAVAPLLPPPPPPPPVPVIVVHPPPKMSAAAKARATRTAAAAAAASAATTAPGGVTNKSLENTSSSGEGTPERGASPPHSYWPDELEETRTKADEYGQEMFLRMFDLFTPEMYAQMQQRRSKRRRRCVQNNNYHYGATTSHEPEAKKKRKAFLLSPQVKKALPNKRNKRRSADNVVEGQSVPASRSVSSSPDDKQTCNECNKGGYVLEACDTCKKSYHPQCHREEDINPEKADCRLETKQMLNEPKICPACKRINDKLIEKEIMINKTLRAREQELKLQMLREKERREILQKTGKSFKIQMNALFKIVNALKSERVTAKATATATATATTTTTATATYASASAPYTYANRTAINASKPTTAARPAAFECVITLD